MEAQLHDPQDTGLRTGEGQGQVHDEGEHHNKKSVLKRVKAKAKKIKDTLKHGLGHEHEHEHEHGREHHLLQGEHGVDEEEEETDDEEMEEDAEVHGGPYAIRSKDIPVEDIVGKQTANLENPTSSKEDRYDARIENEDVHRPSLQRKDEFARPPSVGEKTHFPEEMQRRTPVAETKGIDHGPQGHENIGGASTGGVKIKGNDHEEAVLEPYPPHFRGDMHDPRSALEEHRAKGVDQEITGLEPSTPHLRGEHKSPSAAERDANKGINQVTGQGKLENQGLQGREIGALAGIKEDPHAPKEPIANPSDSNYQSTVTDPTGANNEEAGVSPLVRSFEEMGVDDAPETTPNQAAWQLGGEGGLTGDTKIDQGAEHSQYTGSHDQFEPQETPTDFPSVPKDTESLPKSMDPSKPEDSPQDTLTGKPGSYTEKISSATSAITDKAVAAKNVVASKLGYGGTDEGTNKSPVTGRDKDATKTTSATELAQKAASTVATKLAPVYEKVAGTGSTVMAKVQGTATGVVGNKSGGNVGTEQEGHTTNATDKGVSMKEYLAEKFKPGEEDKALCEVISGSLARQKEKTGEPKLMGKVTESKDVRKLGPIEDAKKEDGDGGSGGTQGEGFGQGVVDRVKDVVSTWLGKGGETQTSPGISNGSGAGGGAVVGGRGE